MIIINLIKVRNHSYVKFGERERRVILPQENTNLCGYHEVTILCSNAGTVFTDMHGILISGCLLIQA